MTLAQAMEKAMELVEELTAEQAADLPSKLMTEQTMRPTTEQTMEHPMPSTEQNRRYRYVALDVETPNRYNNRMSAIGLAVIENGEITDQFFSYVNPETFFDDFNTRLTGISAAAVADAPTFPELWRRLEPILSSGILLAHNAVFDLGVLKKCLQDYGIFWLPSVKYSCTVQMGRTLLPKISHKLDALCTYYGIPLNHHQADSDCLACAEIFRRYLFHEGADARRFIRTYRLG